MSSTNNLVVAVYRTHTQAEQTVKELRKSGFDIEKLSIAGRNPYAEEQVIGFYNAGAPKDSIPQYEISLKTDRFLMMAHGTPEEGTRARDIFIRTRPVELVAPAAV